MTVYYIKYVKTLFTVKVLDLFYFQYSSYNFEMFYTNKVIIIV